MAKTRNFDPCLNTAKDPRFGLLESEAVELVETLRKHKERSAKVAAQTTPFSFGVWSKT